jgi:glycosyltransferase involved in cell wall biosynthesis
MAAAPIRLAVVVSHPIQHQVHLYRALAADHAFEVRVFFGSRIGVEAYHDKEMDTTIKWDGDLLAGYPSQFLPGSEAVKAATFLSLNNPSITRFLAEFKPDAVLLYGYAQITTLRAVQWCRRQGVVALMMSDAAGGQARSGAKKVLRRLILRQVLARFDGFLTVGDRNDAFYAEFGVPTERRFRGAFPIDEGTHRQALRHKVNLAAEVRARHGLASDTFVVLAVGKLSPRKRMDDVITAVASLAQRGNLPRPVHLLVCGDGAEREALAKHVQILKAPVTLVGFVNLDQLPHYFAAADVFVHAASVENFGLVCAEAALMELPIVVSDLVGAVGPTSVAQANRNATVFECGDQIALEDALYRLIIDEPLQRAMSLASRAAFAENDIACCLAAVKRAVGALTGRAISAAGRAERDVETNSL